MSEELSKEQGGAEEGTTEVAAENVTTTPKASPKKKKKWPIVTGVLAVVLVIAGAGFWVWHETPGFCGAICHTPMDVYVDTFDQGVGVKGVDKWGNDVDNTSSMLAMVHAAPASEGGTEAVCLSCHVPTISEQVHEALAWTSGNYSYPLYERNTDDLTRARAVEGDEFCMNDRCHHVAGDGTEINSREDLIAATANFTRNPHIPFHKELACSDCHKAHRASVNACSECHTDAPIPRGWLNVQEAKRLDGAGLAS